VIAPVGVVLGFTSKGKKMKRILGLLLLVSSIAGLSACNTVAGAGQDVSSAGHAVTKSADKHGAE
jgi:entericidin B